MVRPMRSDWTKETEDIYCITQIAQIYGRVPLSLRAFGPGILCYLKPLLRRARRYARLTIGAVEPGQSSFNNRRRLLIERGDQDVD